MRLSSVLSVSVLMLMFSCKSEQVPVYSVLDYEATGDGITESTAAIQNAISDCSRNGGGIVLVPDGVYLCRSLHLHDNVELRLCEGAEILAWEDPEAYDSFVPSRDMSQYDSGDGTINQNNSKDLRWNRALILANGVENIAITGDGRINGRHVFDSLGEESMRGPHALVFGDCSNVRLEGITITCAANYAFMGYALADATFRNVYIAEGWDGIHVRGGQNVLIENCRFETGDDCIAGGYWKDFEMKDCYVNSSCNGVRMIMPSENVSIHDCRFEGPGRYPHRTSREKNRRNMLYGVVFEPGGWGAAPGELRNLCVSDCEMLNVQSPVAVSVGQDNTAYDLTIRRITAHGTYGTLAPVVNYNDKGFENITLDNVVVER